MSGVENETNDNEFITRGMKVFLNDFKDVYSE